LEGRGKSAKGYDYFLSIHCNAGGGSGAEVYCNTRETFAYTEIALRDEIGARLGWRKIASRRYDTAEFVHRPVDEATRKFTDVVQAADCTACCAAAGLSGYPEICWRCFLSTAPWTARYSTPTAWDFMRPLSSAEYGVRRAYKAPEAAAPPEENPQNLIASSWPNSSRRRRPRCAGH
jgi:hypothetical protein